MDGAIHRPVLPGEVLAALRPRDGGFYVDGTVGLGGHAARILAAAPSARVLGLDLDPHALDLAREALAPWADRVELVQASYGDVGALLDARDIATIDGFLLDLGVSSLQLDSPERGFSFRFDAPLDMRFGDEGMTAAELVATASEAELARILRDFGEEPRARRIARALVHERDRRTVATTSQLRRIVTAAAGGRHGRIDPATRTFQAIRIAVNHELDALPGAISTAVRRMRGGGRVAVISFHSLEDRIVKRAMQRLAGRCVCPPELPECRCNPEQLVEILTRRPLTASEDEVRQNPRARSAKLRVAERKVPA